MYVNNAPHPGLARSPRAPRRASRGRQDPDLLRSADSLRSTNFQSLLPQDSRGQNLPSLLRPALREGITAFLSSLAISHSFTPSRVEGPLGTVFYFQLVTNFQVCKPFVLKFIQHAGGVGGPPCSDEQTFRRAPFKRPVSPLESALMSYSQLIENTATLSPLECALTRYSSLTPFRMNTYAKPGGGVTPAFSSNLQFLTSAWRYLSERSASDVLLEPPNRFGRLPSGPFSAKLASGHLCVPHRRRVR